MDQNLAHLVGIVCDVKGGQCSRFAFPSKVGGMPAWLRPDCVPVIECESCKNTMTFLLQIYAPSPECVEAFHRSILIFTCLHCRCFLRAIRSQLPLINEFYGTESLSDDQIPESDSVISAKCCDECGMRKHSAGMCRALPEYGLEIEELDEIDMEDDDEDEDDQDEDMSSDDEMVEAEKKKMADIIKASPGMDIDDSEADVFGDFADTSIEKDKSFRVFKKFVGEAPVNHVIYYSQGGHPLWITEQNQMPGSPPCCEYCGGPRQFEFQIQPQLIFHLMKRLRGFPMNAAPFEWGIVAIYTCTNNCSSNSYLEEFVYNQLEPSEWLEFNARKKIDFTKQSKSAAPKIQTNDESDGEWQ